MLRPLILLFGLIVAGCASGPVHHLSGVDGTSYDLPERGTYKGDIDLSRTADITLPPYLMVRGSLFLTHSQIKSLPQYLSVLDRLDLGYTKSLKTLPAGLKVGGNLVLYQSGITSLPADLQVDGDIWGFKPKLPR